MTDDKDFVGRPIINNGIVSGYLGENGPYSERVTFSGNYWYMYQDDYSYVRWLSGDNDYYLSLDRETQLRLREKLLKTTN